jgi:hypothetical protein
VCSNHAEGQAGWRKSDPIARHREHIANLNKPCTLIVIGVDVRGAGFSRVAVRIVGYREVQE